jgi:gliding motility-associated lipoprotein GldB
MKRIVLPYMAILLLAAACENKQTNLPEKQTVTVEEDELKRTKVDVKVVRLERELVNAKNTAEMSALLKRHDMFVRKYLEIPNAANEQPFLQQLVGMYTNPEFLKFYKENETFYGDFSKQQKQLNELFSYIKYYYPDYYVPEINTLVSGFRFDRDFAFSDSLIVVGIDYFLGKKATYRPQFYDYMLARYEEPYMAPMIALAVSSKYNQYDEKDETMLADMIHYGKAHYFVERMMPELHDSLNIQYTSKELEETDKNLDVIWAHFIEKKLLFDKNNKTKQRYVGESPKVVAIGDNCPGRIGRWLGWQIVRKYMRENPSVTLQQLMNDKDAQAIFKKSNFKVKV